MWGITMSVVIWKAIFKKYDQTAYFDIGMYIPIYIQKLQVGNYRSHKLKSIIKNQEEDWS